MQILITVRADGAERDVWVEGDPATPLSHLADALEAGAAHGLGRAWWSGGRLLDLTRPLGAQVLDGAVLTHSSPGEAVLAPPVPAGELLAVAGPHAGSVWALAEGSHLVGRSDDAAVNLVDDPTVSRRHAVIDISGGEAVVRDEGSAHGTALDGDRVHEAHLAGGALLQVGSTVLAWRTRRPPTSSVVPSGEGTLVFNRPPRLVPPSTPATVVFPGPAPLRSGVNFPLLATVAPVIMGVVLAFALHNMLYLLFTLLAPVIGVSNYLSQRRSGARTHRQRLRAHQSAQADAEAALAEALSAELARRRVSAPDPAALALATEGPATTLWERRRDDPDFMTVRLGLSDQPATTVVEGRPDQGQPVPVLPLLPATVDLCEEQVLGVAGERRRCEALVNSILLQASTLHAPEDVTITVLTGPHQEHAWGWARWLPHARDRDGRWPARIATTDDAIARLAADLSATIDERVAARRPGGTGREGPVHLVVVDGAYRLGALPAVTKILRQGPPVGVVSVCIDDTEVMLPEECRAVAVFDGSAPAGLRLSTGRGSRTLDLLADLLPPELAEPVARRLCPLRLNRKVVAGAVLPANLRLLDCLGLEPPTPEAIVARWSATPRSTVAYLGAGESGPMEVDLARDGPHGLVAGTTGSGKSELLQTMIASLAVSNRPEHMNFVLVDYKGGSAFKECAGLPHTVGMVTDLDGHLTERALASLAAELRRRETLLAEAGATDLEAYRRSAGPDRPVLARLVIVIDEFASLVEELPTFVDGLVDLARRGRSLGIHLVLATQRPSGVVSAAIKTNTNLRVAMRVTDAADSVDVIDSALASRIAKSHPGRGYIRVGHDDVTEFQAARVGGRRRRAGGPDLKARRVGWADLGSPSRQPVETGAEEDTTDLAMLVQSVAAAAAAAGAPTPRRPWLPALPDSLVLPPAAFEPPTAGDGADGPDHEPVPGWIGVEDRPGQQAQVPAVFDPVSDGHLLVVGDPGSGRSTLLRSLAASLAARNRVADVHLYGIDCGNGALAPLEVLPHVGAVVNRREPDRVDRLVTRLLSEVSARQQTLALGGYATIADQRLLAAAADRLPYIVVLLDRWEGFVAEFDPLDGGRLVASVMHLMREGPGAGVRVVVTADRSGTSPRFSSLADRVLMLRLNDRSVYSALGLNPRHLPGDIGPGRAFDPRGGTELQVGLLAPDPSGPAQVAALGRLAAAAADDGTPERLRPDPVSVLPPSVALAPLLARSEPPPGATGPVVLVGVGGDRLAPVEVDLGLVGPGFVVSGPPRCGRSSALVAAALSSVRHGGRVLGLTCRPSPLGGLTGTPGVAAVVDARSVAPADLTALLADLSGPGLTVLVDDAELLADAPIGDCLVAFLRTARDGGSALVVAGTAGEMNQFRGFIPEVRKSRAGVLLCPSPADGDLLGVRLPRTAVSSGPPGRGVLVVNGEISPIQVPFEDLGAMRA